MITTEYIIGGVILLLAIFLIIVVMLQESNSRGLASVAGSTTDSFYSKNKGKTFEAKLARMTKFSATLIMILTIIVGYITNYKSN